MFSSSSSNVTPRIKYDVFLSFRGEDARDYFPSHLHKALRDKHIETFIDSPLTRGDGISLLQVLQESKISIVIFSKKYAKSRRCLEELITILECKKKYKQMVIPVFYEVSPSEVRKQTGSFADAFTKHVERFKENLDTVQTWRNALREAAELSGWNSSVNQHDSILIENIVEHVRKYLEKQVSMPPPSSTSSTVLRHLTRNDILCTKKGLLHDACTKYEKRILAVVFVLFEGISIILDVFGTSTWNFCLASFLISAFGVVVTLYTAFFMEKGNWNPLTSLEIVFSFTQLIVTYIDLVLKILRVKNINYNYKASAFPLVFSIIVLVVAFKTHNKNNSPPTEPTTDDTDSSSPTWSGSTGQIQATPGPTWSGSTGHIQAVAVDSDLPGSDQNPSDGFDSTDDIESGSTGHIQAMAVDSDLPGSDQNLRSDGFDSTDDVESGSTGQIQALAVVAINTAYLDTESESQPSDPGGRRRSP